MRAPPVTKIFVMYFDIVTCFSFFFKLFGIIKLQNLCSLWNGAVDVSAVYLLTFSLAP